MNHHPDKRDFNRHGCDALIEVSYFNQIYSNDAKMLNYGAGGICFQSNQYLQPGATLCIRLKEFDNFTSPPGGAVGLRYVSLAQVKWCHEMPGTGSTAYDVGVKYPAPSY